MPLARLLEGGDALRAARKPAEARKWVRVRKTEHNGSSNSHGTTQHVAYR